MQFSGLQYIPAEVHSFFAQFLSHILPLARFAEDSQQPGSPPRIQLSGGPTEAVGHFVRFGIIASQDLSLLMNFSSCGIQNDSGNSRVGWPGPWRSTNMAISSTD